MRRRWSCIAPWSVAFFLIGVVACAHRTVPQSGSPQDVQNIIFLIGDGMGIPQINAARFKSVGADGSLNIDRFPVVGLLKTHAVDELITDSAAAGTAMACGVKTRNGVLALDANGEPVESILEAAQKLGKATGLVATSTITHATPAAFAAHIDSRQRHAEIAAQILEADVTVLFGGGRCDFVPQSHEYSRRKDGRNLLEEARARGYRIVQTRKQLSEIRNDRVLGLFAVDALAGSGSEPSLAEMTEAAIEILSQDSDGFFMMVEGSQIDWRSHDNDAEGMIEQMLQFDAAIQSAMNFAKRNGRTLVVVTADHETGGMSITAGESDGSHLEIEWSTGGHTAVDIPIFAYGPGAELFAGVYQNTQVAKKFAKLFGIDTFPRQLQGVRKGEPPIR